MERAEKIGLGVAAAGHVALYGVLSFSVLSSTNDAFRSKPIEVMIADEVGLESAAPDPAKVTPATSVAPELGAPEESSFVTPEPLPDPPKAEAKPKPAVAPETGQTCQHHCEGRTKTTAETARLATGG